MNFIKNVLRHRWFVAIVVLLAVGFIFRGTLFPGLYGEDESPTLASGSKEASSTAKAQGGKGNAEKASSQPDKNGANEGGEAATSGPKVADQGQTPEQGRNAQASTSHQPRGSAGRSAPERRAGQQAGGPPSARGASPSEKDAGGGQPSEGDTGSGESQKTGDVRQMSDTHQAARYAYWSGDFQKAERLYQELSQSQPHNPDYRGELGNVYYAQGRWEAAAKAYTEAAVRLIEQGDYPRAHHLYRIVHGLDREKAAEIRNKFDQAQDTSGD